MFHKLSSILALAGLTTAHFALQWPPAEFDDDTEDQSPCGGATVSVSSASPQINVERFAASILVTHPTGSFTFLATTNTTAPYTFTEIGAVNSSGVGTFCENYLSAPSSFAGKGGILQVIDNSIDGVLYQCAPVNFVSGSNDTLGSQCTNSTGQTLTWVSGASTDNTPSGSTTSPMSSATVAATTMSRSSGIAAMATLAAMPVLGLGAMAAGLIL